MYWDIARSASRASILAAGHAVANAIANAAGTPCQRTRRLRQVLESLNDHLHVLPRGRGRVSEKIQVHTNPLRTGGWHSGRELVLRNDGAEPGMSAALGSE